MTFESESRHSKDFPQESWFWGDEASIRYFMLIVSVLAQFITVLITWQLWQVRTSPPHMPVFDINQIPFGIAMVVSLLAILIRPKPGFILHLIVISIASVYDQFRLQPQFLAIIFLMYASIYQLGSRVCRWFMAALWFWAGLHKLLSPHWFTFCSYWLVEKATGSSDLGEELYWEFALAIALAEMLAGVLAVFAPRLAAYCCVGMHLSIFVLLVWIDWNFSVLPWNLATAIVGTWVLWNIGAINEKQEYRVAEWLIAALLFVFPAGFFKGYADHGYANVLYSDFLPRGKITSNERLEVIQGWAPINVPFPSERRTFRKYFEGVAKNGDKLHIFDPRPSLPDLFYEMASGKVVKITEDEFYDSNDHSVKGIGFDDNYAWFLLQRWGKITSRLYNVELGKNRDNQVAYAYTANPDHYGPELLRLLPGLPNLEQLQLADCPVSDDDLIEIAKLKRLVGIGLNNTSVTDKGLLRLSEIPGLRILEIENTRISPEGMLELKSRLGL